MNKELQINFDNIKFVTFCMQCQNKIVRATNSIFLETASGLFIAAED